MLQARLTILTIRLPPMFRFHHYSFALCCEKSTLWPFGASGGTLHWWMVLFLSFSTWQHRAWAQVFDTFDEPVQKFYLWQDDAKAVLFPFKKSEPGLETIETSFGTGSKVFLVYRIDPCAIIEDLNASLRIESAQNGLRIGFRVVFPRSANVATHPLIVEVLFGTPTEGRGKWSKSSIASIGRQFEERVQYLRTQFGSSVDLRDAYVDAVVLSLYSDPGTLKLKVDDLVVEGMVAPTSINAGALPPPADLTTPAILTVQEQLRKLQSTVPRWILHQGESLNYLKELGFNAIITNTPNEPLIIEQAASAQIGVIARPPELVPTEDIAKNLRHVQGWLIGMTLDQSDLTQTRSVVSKLAHFPPSLTRPTVGEAMELYSSYSRYSDLLAIPMPLATRVSSSREAATIMQSEMRPLAGRSLPLTSIATQMPEEWRIQKEIATRTLGRDGTTVDYDLLQVRLQFYRSIMQGARGFIFRSGSPLDSGEPTSMMRKDSYAAINSEIELLKPWIQAGQSSWRNVSTDSPNHNAAILETPKSQLVIVLAAGQMDQICSPAPGTAQVKVTLPVSSQLQNVFRITHGEMEKLRAVQTPEGLSFTIDQPSIIEQIVTTVDPMPVAYLSEKLSQLRASFADSRVDIAQQVLNTGHMVLISQHVPNNDPRWDELNLASSLQRSALQHLKNSNFQSTLKSTDQALLTAQRVVRGSWEQAMSQFDALQSSPLLASPLSLPLHWDLNRLLRGRSWQAIPIPGIPLRDEAQFAKSLWKVDRRLTDNVESICVIGANGPEPNSTPTLVLATNPLNGQPIPSGYGGAVMRVSSPPIAVPEGAMINIQGVVRIQSPAGETQSGLLVCDSIGGESLGQLISSTDASQYAWPRFSLIRFVTSQRFVRIHFETRGHVQAEIANLEITMIAPAPAPGMQTRPYSPDEFMVESKNAVPVSVSVDR